MENVPQVISDANIKDFHAWQDFLSSLGYTNYLRVLNAKDYGVAQNRERCFMFSFLGEYNYKFPQLIPLQKTMEDYLDDEVGEKYYINTEKAKKLIAQLIDNRDLQGCIGNLNPSGNGLNGNVYGGNIAPTLTTNKGERQKICVENDVVQIGNISNEKDFSNPQVGRIYDSNGCAPTLNTCSGGGHEPKIIVAMRGRNPENPSDRTPGSTTEQRLEPNSKGICDALTSVQKDNMVLENLYRIRKLTPRECGRLMDVSDEDITKMEQVNGSSQLYKQFGNSIVVGVMVAMFKNLNIDQR